MRFRPRCWWDTLSNERSRRLALVILRDIHARRTAGNLPHFVICGYKCGEIQRGYDKLSAATAEDTVEFSKDTTECLRIRPRIREDTVAKKKYLPMHLPQRR